MALRDEVLAEVRNSPLSVLIRQLQRLVPVHGIGSPNGVVTGLVGALYVNDVGGAGNTLWVKESGVSTNTGWIAK